MLALRAILHNVMKRILSTVFLVTLLTLTIFAYNQTKETSAAQTPATSVSSKSTSE